ncbi:MAG: hypothetical protein JWQ57_2710 [Mucilaginibacter sp.]|nr:hypothetical protein [Mucilaginibacter sp.]
MKSNFNKSPNLLILIWNHPGNPLFPPNPGSKIMALPAARAIRSYACRHCAQGRYPLLSLTQIGFNKVPAICQYWALNPLPCL